MRISTDLPMGVFHNVVGVAVNQQGVSILDHQGVEKLIPVVPYFNKRRADFQPIKVEGEFGDFSLAMSGYSLQGLEPRDIIHIDVQMGFVDDEEDFHTRLLRLKNTAGINLTWELYCDGNSTDSR